MTGNGPARQARALLVIAAMAALAAAGCASAGSTGPPAQQPRSQQATAAATPVNPVPVLRQTGAKVPHGLTMGGHDVFGDMMATGTMARWETVTVYTAPSAQALRAMLARQTFTPDDYTGVVIIPAERAAILVSAWEDNGPHWAAGGTPAQIAQRVRGHLIGG